MASALLRTINNAFMRLELTIATNFPQLFPHDAHCLAALSSLQRQIPPEKFSIRDVIGKGFLWGVPKHRRTIEARLKRKFGSPQYVLKILQPKNHLRVCNHCGHDHEVGVLCPNCYNKVREETELMQAKINTKLGLEPIEKDVVVLYDGDHDKSTDISYNDKLVIEMQKPRPAWYSKNLLEKTTQTPAETKDVKPTQLG